MQLWLCHLEETEKCSKKRNKQIGVEVGYDCIILPHFGKNLTPSSLLEPWLHQGIVICQVSNIESV